MGWFSKGQRSADETELREEIRQIEGRLKGLETEWASVYAKLQKLVGHITKTESLNRLRAVIPDEQPQAPPSPQRTYEDLTRDEIARL